MRNGLCRELHVAIALLFLVAPRAGADSPVCRFGSMVGRALVSEWKMLTKIGDALALAVPLVGSRQIKLTREAETTRITLPFNRRHPIPGLDPQTRLNKLAPGHEVRDAIGVLWKVETVLDTGGNLILTRNI